MILAGGDDLTGGARQILVNRQLRLSLHKVSVRRDEPRNFSDVWFHLGGHKWFYSPTRGWLSNRSEVIYIFQTDLYNLRVGRVKRVTASLNHHRRTLFG